LNFKVQGIFYYRIDSGAFEKVKDAYWELDLTKVTEVNAIAFIDSTYQNSHNTKIGKYIISYL